MAKPLAIKDGDTVIVRKVFFNPTTGAVQHLDMEVITMANQTNPKHYKGVVIKGVEVQPADIIEAYFPNDGLLSQAAKYLLRAGRKPDVSYLSDVGKCLWWCARAILSKGGTIDLPPQAAYENTTFDGKTGLSPRTTRKKKK